MDAKLDPVYRPSVLVLSGGGIKGFLQLGALTKLHDHGILSGVRKWIGASVGAMTAYLLAIGFTPREVYIIALHTSLFHDHTGLNLRTVLENYGLLDQEKLAKQLEDMTRIRLGVGTPTLKDLKERGVDFTAVSVNLTKMEVAYLNHETAPTLSAVKAVMMSITIPILFSKIEHEGCLYIDGCLGDPFPLRYFDDGKEEILGIVVANEVKGNDGVLDYIYRIATVSMLELRRLVMQGASKRCRTIMLTSDGGTIDAGDVSIGRFEMYAIGWFGGMEFLEKWGLRVVERGFSGPAGPVGPSEGVSLLERPALAGPTGTRGPSRVLTHAQEEGKIEEKERKLSASAQAVEQSEDASPLLFLPLAQLAYLPQADPERTMQEGKNEPAVEEKQQVDHSDTPQDEGKQAAGPSIRSVLVFEEHDDVPDGHFEEVKV